MPSLISPTFRSRIQNSSDVLEGLRSRKAKITTTPEKGGVKFGKQVLKKLNLCRFSSSNDSFYLMRTYFFIRHALKPKHKIHV